MNTDQIRQALTKELGDKWRIEDGGSDSLFCIRSNTYPFSMDIELHMWHEHMLNTGIAAIGRALLAAAGEGDPLPGIHALPDEGWAEMEAAFVAALQALGGGENG